MEWYEWILIGLVWSLIPIGMILKTKQEKRFRKWQKEDIENVRKFIKGIE